MGGTVRALTLMLVVAFTAAVGMLAWAVAVLNAEGPAQSDVTVILPRGASLEEIGRRLAGAGAIEHPALFGLAVRVSGDARALRAGEYLIPARATMKDVIALLASGNTVVRRLTVAEGLTAHEALEVIRTAEGLSGTFEKPVADGSLLPETYHYSYGDSRAEIVRRMQEAMRTLLADLWPERAADLPFDTPMEAVVLASIVEKETAVADERARIAGVFVNRLRRGMRLQSDPTVVYALTGGAGPLGRALTRSDLDVDSPYNTYRYDGLPPGPIANPGRAAIEAVLDPLPTDELYFVADGNGGHAFARTLEEHRENVRRWRALRARDD